MTADVTGHDTAEDQEPTLDEQVVSIAEQYLGFAAHRYLDRQCRVHLDKSLDDIRREDLDDLAMWVNNTAPLIMDKEDGEELAEEIFELKSS